MNTNDATRANAEAMSDPIDLVDALQKAKELIDCIFLAAHGLGDNMKMNAIARVASDAADEINAVQDRLEAPNGAEPRVVVNVGHVLSKMIAEHAEITSAINRHEGDREEPGVVVLCTRQSEIALAICGHRPLTKDEERRKAEFLRAWTADTNLTEDEQKALIASMLPEGGAV